MLQKRDKVAEALADTQDWAQKNGFWGEVSEGHRVVDLGDGNGCFHVKVGEEFELVDDKPVLKPAYEARYAELGPCVAGYAYAKDLGEDGKWGHIIVKTGLPSYEFYLRLIGSVCEGVAFAKFDEDVWGHINPETGKPIYERRHVWTNDFVGKWAQAAEYAEDGKTRLEFHIPKDGEPAYDKRFSNIDNFDIEGRAIADIAGREHKIDCDGKDCGLVDGDLKKLKEASEEETSDDVVSEPAGEEPETEELDDSQVAEEPADPVEVGEEVPETDGRKEEPKETA